MTIKKLISLLKKYPENKHIYIFIEGGIRMEPELICEYEKKIVITDNCEFEYYIKGKR